MKKTLAFSLLISGALLGYWACTTDEIAGPPIMPLCPSVNVASDSAAVCSGNPVTLTANTSGGTAACDDCADIDCTNGIDDDGDSSIDETDCTNSIDDDADGLVDEESEIYVILWNTGDNTQVITKNPTATTTYTVTVTDAGGCSKSSSKTVLVDPVVMVAASVLPLTGNSQVTNTPDVGGTVFNFTGLATGGIGIVDTSYSWTFGDGNTANTQNPTHTYVSPGTYSVTLTVTDDCTTTATDSSISIVVS
ncbi:MAG: PKD domain-containing protein [Acidobacteriota bacterium]|nr:MAG: PKD domain-containing protein [Acidobacteriota bacterium]